ncbi:hypothetical protein ANO14919_073150 [Xylariales sp. No.14919]|nr:ubiquitin carboxyl-terminal hydrolase [Xylaria grammica]GAW17848.1 hypothetical protein ANO14919_073150 [Xylariales sp. No.14919]
MEGNDTTAANLDPGDVPITNRTRRSARIKKVPMKYDVEHVIPSQKPHQPKNKATSTATSDRPKRKAAEAARQRISRDEVSSLHEKTFARMDIDERKEYRGWVEVESEPAFFNAMLQDLNAKSLKVEELFSLDDVTLAGLPQPVRGLIFLFELIHDDEPDEERQPCPKNLWFGNQTTANGCATVALMNILMNTRDGQFGPELEEFRNTTTELLPPQRGHALDTNDFIRAIHNSVARRNDLLSEDLLLDNQFEVTTPSKDSSSKKKIALKKAVGTKKRKLEHRSASYHYIAFVPVDGQVWELDGLERMPLCLGPCDSNTWLGVASEAIQERMGRHGNDFLSFNLLAICQSPLLTLSQTLATSLATAKALDDVVTGSPSWDLPTPWEKFPDDRLARFNLTREQILTQYSPHPSFDTRVNDANFDLIAAQELAEELRIEQEDVEAQYVAEEAAVDEAVEMIRARRRDYTPAVHQWVRILAEKGVLRDLIQEMDSQG